MPSSRPAPNPSFKTCSRLNCQVCGFYFFFRNNEKGLRQYACDINIYLLMLWFYLIKNNFTTSRTVVSFYQLQGTRYARTQCGRYGYLTSDSNLVTTNNILTLRRKMLFHIYILSVWKTSTPIKSLIFRKQNNESHKRRLSLVGGRRGFHSTSLQQCV